MKTRRECLEDLVSAVGAQVPMVIVDAGDGWPGLVRLDLGTTQHLLAIYIGKIGDSGRPREGELALRSPGPGKAMEPVPGYQPILIGVWYAPGASEAQLRAVVSFDAHARMGASARFHLFLPGWLIEETLEHQLMVHRSTSGEPVFAMVPAVFSRFVDALSRSGVSSSGAWRSLASSPLFVPTREGGLSIRVPESAGPIAPRSTESTSITSLHIRNIRGIDELRMHFAPASAGQGQWIILLGKNGSGKTTILRSLVLALRNLSNPGLWPQGVFAPGWRGAGSDAEGLIEVELGDGQRVNVAVLAGGDGPSEDRFLQGPPTGMQTTCPVFAYGVFRGSAMGGPRREVSLAADGSEIASLFQAYGNLVHVPTWLLVLASDADSAAILEHCLFTLADLLEVPRVEVSRREVWVVNPAGARVPLSSMSDGYLATAGWFVDLIARWIEYAKTHNIPIERDFTQKMTGLVLIDEIDLLLHPTWQRRIIRQTRKVLPKVSFIVTTHNPLTLVGARRSEIWVLSTTDGKVSATQGLEAPLGLTTSELFSSYFEIEDVYPDEIGARLQRYSFLAGYALRSDAEQSEMEQLRAALAQEGVAPGWPEIPRRVVGTAR